MPPRRRRTPLRHTLAAALLVLAGAAGWAQPAGEPPASTPMATAAAPALPYAEAVAARFPDPPVRYDTPGLREDRDDYTTPQELAATLRGLAAQPGGPRLLDVGRSAWGRAIEALHFSRGPGRPVVLLFGQQHGDEPAPAEALLALAQQLSRGEGAQVLERIDVVVLPRLNPDGALEAQRRGAHGLDINRDHLLLRTPEARALADLVATLRPLVVVDAHEHVVIGRYLQKFGAVQRHDLLLQYATAANLPAALLRASEEWFRQPLLAALAREGLTAEWYHTNPTTPGDLRLSMGGVAPDIARNVLGLGHAISILLETRGIGIGRLHLQRRVHSHVVAARSVLASAAARAGELAALRAQADAEVAAAACRGEVVVLAAQTPTRRELLMLDPDTGADRALQVHWNSSLELRTLLARPRPCGYWLAPDAADAAWRLQSLGLVLQPLEPPAELALERWRPLLLTEGARPDARGTVGEAATARLVQVRTEALRETVPAGGWWLTLAQPLAHLAVAALEPDTPSSYYANHLLPALDSAARVMLPWQPPRPPAMPPSAGPASTTAASAEAAEPGGPTPPPGR